MEHHFKNEISSYLLGVWNRDYEKDPLKGEISVVFEVSELSEKQKLLMSQMEEFKFIDDTDTEGLWQIHFGKDTRGAAFLLDFTFIAFLIKILIRPALDVSSSRF